MPAGVHRPLRVGADDAHLPAGDLFQVAARAGDRPAGSDPGDEMGDLAVGVGPDLRAGRFVVAGRALRVGVLIGLPGAVDLADQPVGDAVVTARVFRWHRRRAHHHLGAVRAQHVLLVLADLVGADEHAVVAAALSDQGQADAGVSRRRFDDGAARLELSAGLGGVDHLDRDPVFAAQPRIEVLDLGDDPARARWHNRVQLNQWSISDDFTDVLRNTHG